MRKNICLLVLAGLLVTGCSFAPSQLNNGAARYNGVTVVVRGFVKLTPEAHVLYESQALNDEVERGRKLGSREFVEGEFEKYCLTIANPEPLYRNRAALNGKMLTFQGKFVDKYQAAKAVDTGACPLPTAIMIDTAALARRYPKLLVQK
jgi:hypothetical protein